jgi:hypothetical protein
MQLEDAKVTQTTNTAVAADLLYIAPVSERLPKVITAGNLLAAILPQALEDAIGDLPTADPEVAGELWVDNGVLTVSAGPV